MQLARASKLWLIFAPSRSRMPRFSVTVPRSEPARSIVLNLPEIRSILMSFVFGMMVTVI